MTSYSVAEAKNKLSELIDRALTGEEVVITRHGTPVVEIRARSPGPRRVTKESLDWLKANRVGRASVEDAGALVSRMRDEDWL
ncbi:MAG TPA: type II toxin-antitoxin system prevent-host-death family antitoxin [Caulobacter sp.]|nr:type II toxin-antitoxin system prevent-host-death family antitoxin [Caulobacter sp.]